MLEEDEKPASQLTKGEKQGFIPFAQWQQAAVGPGELLPVIENERFRVFIYPPERKGSDGVLRSEHGPAHVHVYTRDDPPKSARLALVLAAGSRAYAVTYPYLHGQAELGNRRFGGDPSGEWLSVNGVRKFTMRGNTLNEAIAFVTGHAKECVNQWLTLYEGLPEQQDFLSPNETTGQFFGRLMQEAPSGTERSR